MTKRLLFFTIVYLLSFFSHRVQAGGVATWKNYMAYSNITWVEKGGKTLYVLASDNLYAYNESDNSIHTFDKTMGLNDAQIAFMGWNNAAKRLVIIYANGNIDLLDEKENITNISDYYNKSMTENKAINDLYMNGNFCYISTGFGILKLNVTNAEVSDTYNLGFNVNYTYVEGDNIYAAGSQSGLYKGSQASNLLDKKNWTRVGDYVPQTKAADPDLMAKARTLNPGGPKYNRFFFMQFKNNRLYTTGGIFESGMVELAHLGTIQVLNENEEWSIFQDNISGITGYNYQDINCLAIDPKNPEHVFAGGKTGLYEFLNGKLKAFFNKDNSPLRPAMDKDKELDNNYLLVLGLCFDDKGSLWILNSQSKSQTLFELLPDGTMVPHPHEALMRKGVGLSILSNALLDSRNLLWFVNKHFDAPALFCYQPSSDGLNAYTRFVNQDGSTVGLTAVKCVAEDLNHDIWIGTNAGPLLLRAAEMAHPDEAIFEQIKVPRDDGTNLADYLLAGVDITCMEIDGGGRKWFGTSNNGVYLISADGKLQIYHFLPSNSPLLSATIESIAINDKTGEVFFGTDKGLCSYMSDATEPVEKMSKDVTYAYPNPVKPGYTGPITIVGLTNNADIKIVTSNGALVAKGTSNGGSFVWDGNDEKGRRVASGVYMVQTADQNGDNGTVCKIAIIR